MAIDIQKLFNTSKVSSWLETVNKIIDYLNDISNKFVVDDTEYQQWKDNLTESVNNAVIKTESFDDRLNNTVTLLDLENVDANLRNEINTQVETLETANKELVSTFEDYKKQQTSEFATFKSDISDTINNEVSTIDTKIDNINEVLTKQLNDFKNSYLNTIYPVGCIYLSVNSTNPNTLFGGTWERIQDTFLLCSGTSYKAGLSGGSATKTLAVKNLPAHTHTVSSVSSNGAHNHTRGTMNITGSVQTKDDLGYVGQFTDPQGAFYVDGGPGRGRIRCTEANVADRYLRFDASRNWTGTTSSEGSHNHTVTLNNTGSGETFNIMPPYLSIYAWKRTA